MLILLSTILKGFRTNAYVNSFTLECTRILSELKVGLQPPKSPGHVVRCPDYAHDSRQMSV